MSSSSAAEQSSSRSDLIAVTLLAALLCGAVAVWWFGYVASPPSAEARQRPADPRLISNMYNPASSAIEVAYNHGDGQLFAAQSTDPLARRSDLVTGGPSERAYRYQRPMYGWLGWLASGGQRDGVAWALVWVTVGSGALLVLAGARFLARDGVDPRWALTLLLAPGVFIDLTWVGPEVLGTALLVLGLDAWRRRQQGSVPIAAVACFAAAGMCRETMLLVPAVLVLVEVFRHRWARGAALSLSALPYLLWVGYLGVAIGALPKGSVEGRLSPVPFGGATQAAAGWTTTDQVLVLLTALLAGAALWQARRSYMGALIAGQVAFAALLGAPVWQRAPDFGRVLLPLWVLSLLVVLKAWARRRQVTGQMAEHDGSLDRVEQTDEVAERMHLPV